MDDTQKRNSGASFVAHCDKNLGDGLLFMRLLQQLRGPAKAEVISDSNGNINVTIADDGNPRVRLVLTTSSRQEALDVMKTCRSLYGDSFARATDSKYCAINATIEKLQPNDNDER